MMNPVDKAILVVGSTAFLNERYLDLFIGLALDLRLAQIPGSNSRVLQRVRERREVYDRVHLAQNS